MLKLTVTKLNKRKGWLFNIRAKCKIIKVLQKYFGISITDALFLYYNVNENNPMVIMSKHDNHLSTLLMIELRDKLVNLRSEGYINFKEEDISPIIVAQTVMGFVVFHSKVMLDRVPTGKRTSSGYLEFKDKPTAIINIYIK